MKRISTALAATMLLGLAACGGRTAANNSAAVDTSNDVYNVSPDDLTLNDLGNASGNGASTGNGSSSAGNSSSSSAGNSASGNSSSGASHAGGNSSATRNSH
jgi:hypothetical protein